MGARMFVAAVVSRFRVEFQSFCLVRIPSDSFAFVVAALILFLYVFGGTFRRVPRHFGAILAAGLLRVCRRSFAVMAFDGLGYGVRAQHLCPLRSAVGPACEACH